MLTQKQIRMLQLLDSQVKGCSKCDYHSMGTMIPFWHKESKYAILSEAPNWNEIRKGIPFLGKGGRIFTEILDEMDFDPKEFLVINSVQCRPKDKKPGLTNLNTCRDYVRKYLKVVDPLKILCLGNISRFFFTNLSTGIMRERGKWHKHSLRPSNAVRTLADDLRPEREYDVLFTVHPTYCIYEEQGKDLLREDLQMFKDKKVERMADWLLSEDDFLIDF